VCRKGYKFAQSCSTACVERIPCMRDLDVSAVQGFLALCIKTSIYKRSHILYTANVELRCFKFFLSCSMPPTLLDNDISYNVSYSGFTQDGSPDLARIFGPNLWIAAKTGTEAKKVMIPCAANDHVQPEVACQGAMKNYKSSVSRRSAFAEQMTYRIDESAEVEEDRVECDDAHGLKGVAIDNIACDHGVAHLNTGSNYWELSLSTRILGGLKNSHRKNATWPTIQW